MMRPERYEERGFTLIEVLIALAILGVSLAVVLTTVSDSLSRTRRGEQELLATSLARSLIDRVGADLALKSSDTSGDADDGFSWRLSVTEYGDDKEREAWDANPVNVIATVMWREAGEERSVTLKTIKILPAEESDERRP
jgi:general secretion pathway protein I